MERARTAALIILLALILVVSWLLAQRGTQDYISDINLTDFTWLRLIGVGLLPLVVYFLIAWYWVGRDPKPGPVTLQYEPPAGLSPAAIRYIDRMSYDDKLLAGALVGLAVKGLVKISDRGDDGYRVTAQENPPAAPLAPEEQLIMKSLLASRRGLSFTGEHSSKVERLADRLIGLLGDRYGENVLFLYNQAYYWIGVGLAFLLLFFFGLQASRIDFVEPFRVNLGSWSAADSSEFAIFAGLYGGTLIFAFGVGLLFTIAIPEWRKCRASGGAEALVALFVTLVSSMFLLAGLYMTLESVSYTLLLICATSVIVLSAKLLPAYTIQARRLLDKIAGFRRYLAGAEPDQHSGNTPELFQGLLPYALALDVERQWAQRFTETLAQAGCEVQEYLPGWYSGDLSSLDDFVVRVGAEFAATIEASALSNGTT